MAWRLPPLNALRAFEAAGRHNSFTLAAQELHVTPGAISRQIKSLEESMGTPLFVRNNRELRLTPEAQILLENLTEAFRRIDKSVTDFHAARREQPLRIMCSMMVAARWLFPRLPRFHQQHPQHHIALTTSLAPPTALVQTDAADVTIRLGTGPWPQNIRAHLLFPSVQSVICSPQLLARELPIDTPADLKHHTLLCSALRPDAWPRWLHAAGVASVDLKNCIAFETSALAYEAAVEGMGVALGESALIADDIKRGRLTSPFELKFSNPESFYLIYPRKIEAMPALKDFCAWILAEAASNLPRGQAQNAKGARQRHLHPVLPAPPGRRAV